MTQEYLETELTARGFSLSKFPVIGLNLVQDGGMIDLVKTLENLRLGRDYHQTQINQAHRFKTQTGADYSDFTDQFDEHVRLLGEYDRAIEYIREIIRSFTDRS